MEGQIECQMECQNTCQIICQLVGIIRRKYFIHLFIYIYLGPPVKDHLSIMHPLIFVSLYPCIHISIQVSLSLYFSIFPSQSPLSLSLFVRPSVRGQIAMNIPRSPVSDSAVHVCVQHEQIRLHVLSLAG